MKVCHFTSAHDSNDIRVFVKECCTLSDAGYDTYLIASGISREENGVHVIGIGEKPKNRIKRMITFSRQIYRKAIDTDCDIYHFHDPELLKYAIRLKRQGKIVIYDSHEDVPAQIMDKTWIPHLFRKIVSYIFEKYESYIVKRIDAVVAATPYIASNFQNTANKVICVCNYPIITGIKQPIPYTERKYELGYTGIRLSYDRGAKEMVQASNMAQTKLEVYGRIIPDQLLEELKEIDSNNLVTFHGLVPYEELQNSMANMQVGLLVEHPTDNAMNALCIKMFEYMAHGMAIISSNIPLWKEIIDDASCGVCVDPYNVKEISSAIHFLKQNPNIGNDMGMRGYNAVINKYSWENEAKKLYELYSALLY